LLITVTTTDPNRSRGWGLSLLRKNPHDATPVRARLRADDDKDLLNSAGIQKSAGLGHC